mgnify:CR=1 FL=1
MLRSKFTLLILFSFFSQIVLASSDSTSLFREIESLKKIRINGIYSFDSAFHSIVDIVETNQWSLSIKHQAFNEIGEIKANYGLFEEAEPMFMKMLDISKQVNDTLLMVKSFTRLAENYLDQNQLDLAVDYGIKALELSERKGDFLTMAIAESSLAETYRHAGKLNLSEKYNLQAIEHYKKVGNWYQVARCYNNFAAAIGKMGRNLEAIDTLKKSMQFVNDTDYFSLGKHYSNIAYCFRNMANYDSALYYNKKSLYLKEKIHDGWGIGYSLGAIGRSYEGLGLYDSAIHYTLRSLDTTLKYKSLYRIKDAAYYVSNAYRAAGKYKEALDYLDMTMRFDDSIYVEEQNAAIEQYQRKYDFSKKEAEIKQLKSEQELEKANQRVLLVFFIGLSFLLIALVLIFRLRARKREQEKKVVELELQNSKQELESHKSELILYTRELMDKNKSIKKFQQKVIEKEEELELLKNTKSEELEQLSELKILTDEDWTRFKTLFERVHPGFFEKLSKSSFDFTKGEKRLLALTRLNMSHSEIADTLGISTESVTKSRFRLKKKLVAEKLVSIEDYVHQL